MTTAYQHKLENLLKLKQTPELLQLFADAFPFLISYVDKDRTYRFHNKEYEKRFSRTYDEIHGKHIADLLGREAYDIIKPYVDKVLSGEWVHFESLIPYKDGDRFMDVQYIPDVNDKNEVLGFIAIVHYVSDTKKSEAATPVDRQINEIMSSLIEISCLVEEVRIKLNDSESSLKRAREKSDTVNDTLKKWTADLKASENMMIKVKTAISEWIEKNTAD